MMTRQVTTWLQHESTFVTRQLASSTAPDRRLQPELPILLLRSRHASRLSILENAASRSAAEYRSLCKGPAAASERHHRRTTNNTLRGRALPELGDYERRALPHQRP